MCGTLILPSLFAPSIELLEQAPLVLATAIGQARILRPTAQAVGFFSAFILAVTSRRARRRLSYDAMWPVRNVGFGWFGWFDWFARAGYGLESQAAAGAQGAAGG
ncbi:hypothetical protein J8I87_23140 [Paraburkholderia sp. LEh10]|uniref:hypothetical protein n=1 Tax=Paraburkholderia sp. LEh10 TaxID=2821353 RepID=UPI001AE3DAB2|nr:hypothetical protein [Paraburkholderia sp. LEh10]MBP0592579.1 hypothetical protein [Paraburkholderia sp. LEh10]